MKKMSLVLMVALFIVPMIAMSESPVTENDSTQVVASYPPTASDVEAAPAKPVASAPVTLLAEPSPPASVAVAPVKEIEDAVPVSKKMEVLLDQMATLQDNLTQLEQQEDRMYQEISKIHYVVYVLAGLVVLLALLSFAWRGQSAKTKAKTKVIAPPPQASAPSKAQDDTQGEYDFMGSTEGIPAKLDLARAYIAMEDYTAARETLIEILGEGSEEQRHEAQALLNNMH